MQTPPYIPDEKIVEELRRLKSLGHPPSALLKYLKGELSGAYFIKYFRAAFGMSLKAAKPVAGWLAMGLSDERVDQFISEEW
ncbi:hypothetical protein [Undibacterium pigrum]|uniref:hypothetical protein n=1 Tax=Undibacterium pigrum TaxID=401470 RepID=UPI000D751E25|nr:hypothetical protein [Undibacterium pigrum]